jgi:hypothetical protein
MCAALLIVLAASGVARAEPDVAPSVDLVDDRPTPALPPEPEGLTVGHPETKGPLPADDISAALTIMAPYLRRCFTGAPTGSLVLAFSVKRRGLVVGAHVTESSFEESCGACLVAGLEDAMLVPGAAGSTSVTVRWGWRAPE